MASPRIVLVRHGATEWSVSGQHTGVSDIPLTEEGRRAAQAVRERLAGREFAIALVSPLGRARETADLAGYGDRVEVEPDLREVNYGEYEGRTTTEIRDERPGWSVWRDGSPGGEPVDDAGERAERVIARALESGGDAVLFAHAHILRILTARWLELPAAYGGNFPLGTAALCELGYERERRAIWLWNDQSHLR
jgi:broad specificity phosphatase PhoE